MDYPSLVRWWPLLLMGCASPSIEEARAQYVVNAIAEDNYEWSLREPALVRMKLTKMQRDPFDWLRGTPVVFWRDVNEPGNRAPTKYGSEAASHVLLCADPHPENLGSFLAGDGTILLDWNDFDSAGYGPFEGDLRRLTAGLIIATRDPDADVATFEIDTAFAHDIATSVATGYLAQLADLANGVAPKPTTTGSGKYVDKLLAKAITNGDAKKELADNTAIDGNGHRYFQLGDQDPVADDGVIESRLDSPTADQRDQVTRALQPYLATHDAGTIVDIARKYGSGVSSYAAWRFYVLTSTDVILEVKEERDGLVIHGYPQLQSPEWESPAARVVNTQRRLQARTDSDELLGGANATPLSFRVHHETAYQRGVNSTDLGALYADPAKRDQFTAIAQVFGGMLARAHGVALTQDGVPGWSVIVPAIGGDDAGFTEELAAFATADAQAIAGDWRMLRGVDIGSMIIPRVGDIP